MTYEEFREAMCDEYCKYAIRCTKSELDEKCDNCILNELEFLEKE